VPGRGYARGDKSHVIEYHVEISAPLFVQFGQKEGRGEGGLTR
jgi:hypothetical protein